MSMGRVADFFVEQNIALALQQKKKMLALDNEFSALEAKVKVLEAEKLHLEAEINPLKREVERLKNQAKQKSASHERLDEITEKMLLDIANSAGVKAEVISNAGLSHAKGEYHFDILVARRLIARGLQRMGLSFYNATPEGRKYLVDHKLI